MPSKLSAALVVAATLLAAAAASRAIACAFDSGGAGVFDGSFEAVQPKASVVYFAIVDAVEQGVLDRAAFQTITPGAAGYWQAVGRINGFHRRLAAANGSHTAPALSLLFIESNLWARLEPGPQGLTLSVHTPRARDGDVVVLTSEGALAAVLDGRLPVKAALDRGLIALDGEAAGVDRAKALIAAAFDAAPGAPAVAARSAPVRLFGPAR